MTISVLIVTLGNYLFIPKVPNHFTPQKNVSFYLYLLTLHIFNLYKI